MNELLSIADLFNLDNPNPGLLVILIELVLVGTALPILTLSSVILFDVIFSRKREQRCKKCGGRCRSSAENQVSSVIANPCGSTTCVNRSLHRR